MDAHHLSGRSFLIQAGADARDALDPDFAIVAGLQSPAELEAR